jgi:hypothetical protein
MPKVRIAGHAVCTTLHTKSAMTAAKRSAVPRSRYRYGRSEVAERLILSATSEFNAFVSSCKLCFIDSFYLVLT